jgi:threonine/homoserine/homoserine lactone efflux protein
MNPSISFGPLTPVTPAAICPPAAGWRIDVTLSGYGLFCGIYLLAVLTPGPAVAAILARSVSVGMQGAVMFVAGLLLGDLCWFTCAAFGLAALATRARLAFEVLRYVGVAYLLFLALRLWAQRPKALSVNGAGISERPWRTFLGSLSLTLGNPKSMVFYLALMPAVVRLDTLTAPDYLLLALAICVILPLVLLTYALAASRARRLFTSPRSLRWLNRSAGAGMAGAAMVIVLE